MKNQKGITLVALVVTIIILIILAGVSINMLVGESGIITQAQRAAKDTTNARVESEEQMNLLVDEMNKYMSGNGETEDETTIQLSELKAGDYIKYDTGVESIGTIICRVLYPVNSSYGLQIISDKIVEQVTLGGDTFEEGRNSYNNAIENLNNKAEAYINTKYALDARCVGSIPTVENQKFIEKDKGEETTVTLPIPVPEGQDSSTWWNPYVRPTGWNDDDTGCYDEDENYITDQLALESAGTWINGEIYWLASHFLDITSGSCYFNVRKVHQDGVLGGDDLCNVITDGRISSAKNTYGLRPCILLREDIQITGGDGKTEATAYTIE